MGPLASQTWDRRTRRPQPQSRVCTLEDSPHSLPDSTSNASAVALQQTTQLSLQKRHEVNTRLAARGRVRRTEWGAGSSYRFRTNLKVKVLAFVQLGGAAADWKADLDGVLLDVRYQDGKDALRFVLGGFVVARTGGPTPYG